jgi:hypothetical protein
MKLHLFQMLTSRLEEAPAEQIDADTTKPQESFALEDEVDGGNGVYIYSADSAFPTNSFKSSNYWVDVVFTSP